MTMKSLLEPESEDLDLEGSGRRRGAGLELDWPAAAPITVWDLLGAGREA